MMRESQWNVFIKKSLQLPFVISNSRYPINVIITHFPFAMYVPYRSCSRMRQEFFKHLACFDMLHGLSKNTVLLLMHSPILPWSQAGGHIIRLCKTTGCETSAPPSRLKISK